MIPAQAPDPSQYDNSFGGSGFMLATTDFYGFAGGLPSAGANQIAVFDWTGQSALNSPNCNSCFRLHFGGQLFSGVQFYNDPENAEGVGVLGAQKTGPDTAGRRMRGRTRSGNGGPAGADNGGFFPSTAFGRLSSTSGGLLGAIHVADLGQSPTDDFTGVPELPGSHPAALGRLQLGDLRAVVWREDRLRYELHPVSELHRIGVHADACDLRRDQGWLRELGNLGELRGALGA